MLVIEMSLIYMVVEPITVLGILCCSCNDKMCPLFPCVACLQDDKGLVFDEERFVS